MYAYSDYRRLLCHSVALTDSIPSLLFLSEEFALSWQTLKSIICYSVYKNFSQILRQKKKVSYEEPLLVDLITIQIDMSILL